MPDRDSTETQDYSLVNLSVDGQGVPFATATITTSITWVGPPGDRRRVSSWLGEIVLTIDERNVIPDVMVHSLAAETTHGDAIEGYFTITRSHSKGFEIAGSGELTFT